MMNYITSALLASSMLFSLAGIHASEKPVTFKGSIQPNTAKADHFTVTVELDIKNGWHTYGEGSDFATSLKLKLPEGVKAVGDWDHPVGKLGAESHSEIYVGKVSFSKSVIIQPSAYGKSIDVIVSYQACTDEYCNRPTSKTVSIEIPGDITATPSIFEAPVRITVDGKPLNTAAKKRFVSPGIFDVDGDGQIELVIGSLMGSVGVYENQNESGTGDPVWSSRQALKDSDGQPIQTSNW